MKRSGRLYDRVCALENVRLAHRKARRGKGHYREVRQINAAPDEPLRRIARMLAQKAFKTSDYTVFERVECGKRREIYKLPYYPDRIVHHCIMNVLEPIWMRVFIRDTYGSLKGRGIHDGVRRVRQFLKDEEGTRYCLKMDVAKFYPSVDHDILKSIIRRSIKCRDTLWLLDSIIDSAPGIPIGNYVSQFFGNLYLAYFDHWVKESVGVRYYARYCDDLVILGADKSWLHDLRSQIETYLADRLNLRLKGNWQVFPTRTRGIDFLGYRFFGSHTLIRRRIADKFKRAAGALQRRPNQHNLGALVSYRGWLQHADGHNLWRRHAPRDLENILAAVGARATSALKEAA